MLMGSSYNRRDVRNKVIFIYFSAQPHPNAVAPGKVRRCTVNPIAPYNNKNSIQLTTNIIKIIAFYILKISYYNIKTHKNDLFAYC